MRRIALVSALLLLPLLYLVSIYVRVGLAELTVFGRSPLFWQDTNRPKFTQPPARGSYGSATYRRRFRDRDITVWSQKINGFQHIYGSALVTLELDRLGAKAVFDANELVEALFRIGGEEELKQRDRKKDLFHNKIGRDLGAKLKNNSHIVLSLDDFLIKQTVEIMEAGGSFIPHDADARIDKLSIDQPL